MIDYEFGTWGVLFVFKSEGSVFKRSLVFALPSAVLGYVLSKWIVPLTGMDNIDTKGLVSLWGSFTFILGFLLVFRTQIAYGRFWEGCMALTRVRSVWFNAVSNLFAFTSSEPHKIEDVELFQHCLVRLFSLMHCQALQQVAVMEDDNFEILGDEGFDKQSLVFLHQCADRMEVVLQWIQRLIVHEHDRGTLAIAPPILSRVFQELSNGISDVNTACVITEYPFPFPYAQMLSVMLLMHLFFNPVVCALVISNPLISAGITYSTVLGLWTMNYIAAEIEMPFGDDANDLPMHLMQDGFNRRLRTLLNPMAQHPPSYEMEVGEMGSMKSSLSAFHAIGSSLESVGCGLRGQVPDRNSQMGSVVSDFGATFSSTISQQTNNRKSVSSQKSHKPKAFRRRKSHWTTISSEDWQKKLNAATPENIAKLSEELVGVSHNPSRQSTVSKPRLQSFQSRQSSDSKYGVQALTGVEETSTEQHLAASETVPFSVVGNRALSQSQGKPPDTTDIREDSFALQVTDSMDITPNAPLSANKPALLLQVNGNESPSGIGNGRESPSNWRQP